MKKPEPQRVVVGTRRLLKGEEQFAVAGKVTIKLAKFPSKDAAISSYPDSWSVVMEVDQAGDVKLLTLRPWDENFRETKAYYDRLSEFLKGQHEQKEENRH